MAINTGSVTNTYSSYSAASKTSTRISNTNEAEVTTASGSTKKSGNYGKTIGDAKLSVEGAKYYKELKDKHSNMEFILVSSDQKENAQANAGAYANARKMVVLIDEEKIERMATDENYRKQYEGIIKNAASGLSQLQANIEVSGQSGNVQGYGMKVNDGGTASFFAVLKQSSSNQKARIEKRAEEKRAEKKAEKNVAEKKAENNEKEERLHKSRGMGETEDIDAYDTVTITANSIEELMRKINEYTFDAKSNSVQTEEELQVGQHIDFRG